MLELLFLLLPIAALYGWYMGQRSARKEQDSQKNQFSRDYMTGLNFLLSNKQEKAVDLFLSMLEKQEAENQIASESQFEAELTLGNLFRSRGEVDKALRIHQNLDDNPNYSTEQKFIVKQQLAKDFVKAGFYDRAENYYIKLLDEPEYAETALKQLANVYQRTKEWEKAINVTEKLCKILPESDRLPLSHFYCEYAKLNKEDEKLFLSTLGKALEVNLNSTRASILLGNHFMEKEEFKTAREHFENILKQDPNYISEVLDKLKLCYESLDDLDNFELFLIKANQIKHNSAIDIALTDLMEYKYGTSSASSKLYQQVSQYPSMITFHRFIQYQIDEAEGSGKESLELLHKMVGHRIQKDFKYRCLNCGYQSYRLYWFCPSCRKWEMVKPVQSIDLN